MNYCKVIVCSNNTNRAKRNAAKWPDHNQDLTTELDFAGEYMALIANELRYDAGVTMDTVIVMNGGIPLLAQFNNTYTQNGRIICAVRENEGGSFGGYNFAYNEYKYDYYLFTEEDLFVVGDLYYEKLLDRFKSEYRTGFVGLIGVSTNIAHPTHCHGGVGLTSRKVLSKVYPDGVLPNPNGIGWDRTAAIQQGEIPFTSKIYQAGYKLIQYGTNEWKAENLILPYQ
jgi:hypothetical protein